MATVCCIRATLDDIRGDALWYPKVLYGIRATQCVIRGVLEPDTTTSMPIIHQTRM